MPKKTAATTERRTHEDTEKAELAKLEDEGGPIPSVAADNYRAVYSNHVSVTATPWDIQFRFGTIQSTIAEGQRKVFGLEEVGIYMSPQHAIAFRKVLDRQLKAYEARFGPIPEPTIEPPSPSSNERKRPS